MDIFQTQPFERLLRQRIYRIAILLILTVCLGLLLDLRIGHAGGWLPRVPIQFEGWNGKEMRMDWTFVDAPKYLSRIYANYFDEGVQTVIIAPESAYGYRDPRGCLRGSGYLVTAERRISLGGPNAQARLMILRLGEGRMVMCYWMQERQGDARPEAPVFAYHAIARAFATLRMLGNALVTPRQICMVRVFAVVDANDPLGKQAQRNVLEMAKNVYQTISRQ